MLLAKAAECGSMLAVLHIANTLVIRTSANHIGFSRCSSTRTMVVKKGMKELHYFYCAVWRSIRHGGRYLMSGLYR